MDSDFLELWGNLLLSAAKGQRQIEEINKWVSQGLKGFDDLSNMVLSFYGVENKDEDAPLDRDTWAKVRKGFLGSYYEYIKQMGMVPEAEYQALCAKYKELEKKSTEQEETIAYLKNLLRDKLIDPTKTVENFQGLINKQSERFQKLMQGLNKAMSGADKVNKMK
jgi:hypothetical protein